MRWGRSPAAESADTTGRSAVAFPAPAQQTSRPALAPQQVGPLVFREAAPHPVGLFEASEWSKQVWRTGQPPQMTLAAASRASLASPRSRSGWKKTSESIPRHAAANCQSQTSAFGPGNLVTFGISCLLWRYSESFYKTVSIHLANESSGAWEVGVARKLSAQRTRSVAFESDADPGIEQDVLLSVSEAAARTGLTAATLRTWHRRYGLGPSVRTSGGHRRYNAADMARLRRAARLVDSGVPRPMRWWQAAVSRRSPSKAPGPAGAGYCRFPNGTDVQRGLARAAMSLDARRSEGRSTSCSANTASCRRGTKCSSRSWWLRAIAGSRHTRVWRSSTCCPVRSPQRSWSAPRGRRRPGDPSCWPACRRSSTRWR